MRQNKAFVPFHANSWSIRWWPKMGTPTSGLSSKLSFEGPTRQARWTLASSSQPRLLSQTALKEAIEALVESGDVDEVLLEGWRQRKKSLEFARAQDLYDQGRVSEAAKLGLAQAQAKMAENCYYGDCVEADYQRAFEWATKAAEAGNTEGQFWLGYAYRHGVGAQKDWAVAVKWYELAAEQGGSTAMANLGILYYDGGHGISQDLTAAVSWFRKGWEAEDDEGSGTCAWGLGRCYYYGKGVTKDLAAARSWHKKGADEGDLDAKYQFGKFLLRGEGGARERLEGLKSIESAAVQGQRAAASFLKKFDKLSADKTGENSSSSSAGDDDDDDQEEEEEA
mmetsp:Transcript_29409/g.65845  ORF Transcript_29409/g.65845 Transcript_29409/m.65845 type:complete len:338 (-) Transcript_29409:243-1256(-)